MQLRPDFTFESIVPMLASAEAYDGCAALVEWRALFTALALRVAVSSVALNEVVKRCRRDVRRAVGMVSQLRFEAAVAAR